MLESAYRWHSFEPGAALSIGPFAGSTVRLPHTVPNAGIRLAAGTTVVSYTGDTGPSDGILQLAHEADLLIIEASVIDGLSQAMAPYALTAAKASAYAAGAGVGRLMLTHLYPDTDAGAALAAASATYGGPCRIATAGLVIDLD